MDCGEKEDKEVISFFFFQAEDGIRDYKVTGVQTCALPISSYARSTSASVTPSAGASWSVPAPHTIAPLPPVAGASASERRISSRAAGQSSPMPRWAASIASATPRPRDHRWRRYASAASQSMRAAANGSASARGSATTWAAAYATRQRIGPAGGGPLSPRCIADGGNLPPASGQKVNLFPPPPAAR